MRPLRPIRPLARLLLAWVLLTLAVANASPLLRADPGGTWVCGASGTVWHADGDSGGADGARNGLDCPTCLLFHAPGAGPSAGASLPLGCTPMVDSACAPPTALRASPPLPARGPPA